MINVYHWRATVTIGGDVALGWSKVLDCIKASGNFLDMDIFPHLPRQLHKDQLENLEDGDQSALLTNIFDSLADHTTHHCLPPRRIILGTKRLLFPV